MFGAFFIGVDSFFNMCRVAAPNVEVEHLYSCIHFCGIAAGSSVFVRKKHLCGCLTSGRIRRKDLDLPPAAIARYGMKFQTFQEEMWWKGSLIGAGKNKKKGVVRNSF